MHRGSRVSRRVRGVDALESRLTGEVSVVTARARNQQRKRPPVNPGARRVSAQDRCVSDRGSENDVMRSRGMSIVGIQKPDASKRKSSLAARFP
jgi:hypothetical protein